MPTARLFVFIAGLLAAWPASSKEFRSSDIYPTDYPTVQAIVQMDRMLRERSGGRHGITVISRERPSPGDTVALLQAGQLDIARVNASSLDPGSMAAVVPSLPFLFRSTAQMRRVLDGPVGDEILASLETKGLVGLCFYDAGPRSFYSVKQPIRSAADLKGLKVRVQPAGFWATIVRALGGEPVGLPFDQVATAFGSREIEAADNNWPTYVAARHFHVAKHFSLTEHSMAPAVLLFAKPAWDQLSREDQVLIRSVARDSAAHIRKLWDDYDKAARKTVEAAGGQIIGDVDRKSFADEIVPLYPSLLGEARLRDMVRRIQSEE